MFKHEYYNTIWSNRDQEFWWAGIKEGFVYGLVAMSFVCVCGMELCDKIKEYRRTKKHKEES